MFKVEVLYLSTMLRAFEGLYLSISILCYQYFLLHWKIKMEFLFYLSTKILFLWQCNDSNITVILITLKGALLNEYFYFRYYGIATST